jgi:hypothetical protein
MPGLAPGMFFFGESHDRCAGKGLGDTFHASA